LHTPLFRDFTVGSFYRVESDEHGAIAGLQCGKVGHGGFVCHDHSMAANGGHFNPPCATCSTVTLNDIYIAQIW